MKVCGAEMNNWHQKQTLDFYPDRNKPDINQNKIRSFKEYKVG